MERVKSSPGTAGTEQSKISSDDGHWSRRPRRLEPGYYFRIFNSEIIPLIEVVLLATAGRRQPQNMADITSCLSVRK